MNSQNNSVPDDEDSNTTSARPTTCVNGIGMFSSWKRNFKSPFFAMLDIIDNAIDAAFENRGPNSFEGKVELYTIDNNTKNGRPSPVRSSLSQGRRKNNKKKGSSRTELIIVNNSLKEIQDLSTVLEVHRSKKGSCATNIGENGVGLKQGCAAMSDMSFVITRNIDAVSFGIIAKCLQHEGGCYLPSFKLKHGQDVKENLKEILNYKDLAAVAECVATYGMGSLDTGIQMLADHIEDLNDEQVWGLETFVFKLVIADVYDVDEMENEVGMSMNENLFDIYDDEIDASDDKTGNELEEEKVEEVVSSSTAISRRLRRTTSRMIESSKKKRTSKLSHEDMTSAGAFQTVLKQLAEELPRYYIHIPPTLAIIINAQRIKFNYWQRHLIEIMRFDQKVDENESFRELESLEPAKGNLNFRIFCGFDPIRARDKDQASSLSVYIYSRRSGRLIKHAEDGRNMLKITAGGTAFCQGLTCIIDDHSGKIPLNPTKQDVAFSEKPNGEILGENLYAWTSAIVSIYYRFHLKKFDDKKGDLSLDLRPFADALLERYSGNSLEHNNLKLLADCDFSSMDGIKFTKISANGITKILAKMSQSIREIDGIDSEFRLRATIQPTKKRKKAKARTSTTAKAKTAKKSMTIKAEPLKKRKRYQSKRSKDINVINGDCSDSEELEDFEIEESSDEEKDSVKKGPRKRSERRSTPIGKDDSELESLIDKLEQEKHINARQLHDNKALTAMNTNLQNENNRLFEEVDHLKAKLRSNNDYEKLTEEKEQLGYEFEMLMEVKNNLELENERLHEEVGYHKEKGSQNEDQTKLQQQNNQLRQDNELHLRKIAALEHKLTAERSLRESVEEELKVLEDQNRLRAST